MANLNKLRIARFLVSELSPLLPNATVGAGGGGGQSSYSFRHGDTTGFGEQRLYGAQIHNDGGGTGSPPVDTMRAVPFYSGSVALPLDVIRFDITSLAAAGGVARIGIYSSVGELDIYPDALVVDSGEIETDAIGGVRDTSIDVTLAKDQLYWFVYLAGTAAATIRMINPDASVMILGYDNDGGSQGHHAIEVAQTYGALPATFPAGATGQNAIADGPNIMVRVTNS